MFETLAQGYSYETTQLESGLLDVVGIRTLSILVASRSYLAITKKLLNWLKPWHNGTHLILLSESQGQYKKHYKWVKPWHNGTHLILLSESQG